MWQMTVSSSTKRPLSESSNRKTEIYLYRYRLQLISPRFQDSNQLNKIVMLRGRAPPQTSNHKSMSDNVTSIKSKKKSSWPRSIASKSTCQVASLQTQVQYQYFWIKWLDSQAVSKLVQRLTPFPFLWQRQNWSNESTSAIYSWGVQMSPSSMA